MVVRRSPADQAYDAWVDQNPLRQWRKSRRWAVMRVATTLGVSMTIIQAWERGVHVPSEENMARISELVGPKTPEKWAKWFNQRPALV